MISLNAIINIAGLVAFVVSIILIIRVACTGSMSLNFKEVVFSPMIMGIGFASILIASVVWFILVDLAFNTPFDEAKIDKYSSVSSVIYDVTSKEGTKFQYKKDKNDETYQTLKVWYEDGTDEPYLANITLTNKSNNLKFTAKYLVLDESYRDYGLNVIFSENNTEKLDITPMASVIYTGN